MLWQGLREGPFALSIARKIAPVATPVAELMT